MTAAVSSARATGARRDPLLTAIIVLSVIGIGVAGYLVYIHYAKISPICLGGHHGQSSCETVQSSVYAKLAGVPVAVLGLIGYVVILGSLAIPGDVGTSARLRCRVDRLRLQRVPHLP